MGEKKLDMMATRMFFSYTFLFSCAYAIGNLDNLFVPTARDIIRRIHKIFLCIFN